jgi:hypothetical protein
MEPMRLESMGAPGRPSSRHVLAQARDWLLLRWPIGEDERFQVVMVEKPRGSREMRDEIERRVRVWEDLRSLRPVLRVAGITGSCAACCGDSLGSLVRDVRGKKRAGGRLRQERQ